MLIIGSVFSAKYRILNMISQSEMNVVYLASDQSANKNVLIKEAVKWSENNYKSVSQELIAQADILKGLSHPNLSRIIDVYDIGDFIYVVTEYIDGVYLDRIVEEYGAQPEDSAVEMATQLCDVLSYLHSKIPNRYFGNIKLSNILVKPDGTLMLTNYETFFTGAAGMQYQYYEKDEIYCIGLLLHHVVTGSSPYESMYALKPVREINADLSVKIDQIVYRCTQFEDSERCSSLGELYSILTTDDLSVSQDNGNRKKALIAFVFMLLMTIVFATVAVWSFVTAENIKADNSIKEISTSDEATVPTETLP